jgi:predicted amidohydrolase YtcJ
LIVPYLWVDALERLGLDEGFGDDRMRLSALKSFADGSLGARTAALRAPYADAPDGSGLLLLTEENLVERILRGHSAGLRSAVHAIGDRAMAALIRAAERMAGEGPPPRVEHASVCDPSQAQRMGRLGMSASVQPQFISSDFWTRDRLGPERASWAYAFRTLRDTGVNLAGSTDCPVERPDASSVYCNFVRRADGNDSESLTAEEALHALTLGAERSLEPDSRGAWEPGRGADFLILRPEAVWPLQAGSDIPIERVVFAGRPLS